MKRLRLSPTPACPSIFPFCFRQIPVSHLETVRAIVVYFLIEESVKLLNQHIIIPGHGHFCNLNGAGTV